MDQDAAATKATSREAPSTWHSIQVLRAVAAGLVALFHAHQALVDRVSRPWFSGEEYILSFGAVGVHIFFVISGFIMVLTSFSRGGYDPRTFYKRRLSRVYPIYWIIAAIYLAVHSAIGQPYNLTRGEVLGGFALWPGYAAGIIGPAWTLAFEVYFYLCFGLAMVLGINRGLALLAGFFVLSIAASPLFLSLGVYSLANNPLLVEFLFGTAIGWLTVKGKLPRFGPGLVLASLVLFAVGFGFGFDRLPSALSWGIPSALLVCGVVAWERLSSPSKMVRILGRLGDSSYMLYLVHILLVTLSLEVVLRLPDGFAPAPLTGSIVIASACIGIAHALHWGLERPLLRVLSPKRRLVPRQDVSIG